MNKNNSLTFSLVILSSGIIIAAGILVYRANLIDQFKSKNVKEVLTTEEKSKIQPITAKDNILGNPNADVVIIEYSDFGCPYCKEFHNTMRLMIEQYGASGKVAWIYRHSPIGDESSSTMKLSLTSECINKLYDSSQFWNFTNRIFENAPNSLEQEVSDQIIENMGLDLEKITSCLTDVDIIEKVQNDIKDRDYLASKDSDFGTPYNIIKKKNGESVIISGAAPYVLLREIIE